MTSSFWSSTAACSAPNDPTQRDKIVNRDMMMPPLGAGSFHMTTSTGNKNHIGGESFPNIMLDSCHLDASGVIYAQIRYG
jgi:hypothetical protein